MRLKNRSFFNPKINGLYRIKNKAEEATVYIYDEISWFGVQAEQFVKDLNNIKAKKIHLRVNSPGGSVFDGTSIYNAVKQHPASVIAHVDGLAASIASVIIMAADEVHMSENAFLMIHEPFSFVIGNADDMRHEADLLDKVGGTIMQTYMDKTGKGEDEIKDMMAKETWFTAQEASDMGFCDHVDKETKEKAQLVLFDLSVFANVPDTLKENRQPTARDLERVLRDAGCSAKQAKSILSKGVDGDLRDEETANALQPANLDQRDVEPQVNVVKDRTVLLLKRAATV